MPEGISHALAARSRRVWVSVLPQNLPADAYGPKIATQPAVLCCACKAKSTSSQKYCQRTTKRLVGC